MFRNNIKLGDSKFTALCADFMKFCSCLKTAAGKSTTNYTFKLPVLKYHLINDK